MAVELISIPVININDDSATLTRWLVESGSKVRAGSSICELETTKSITELTSPSDGYIETLVDSAESYPIGTLIAKINHEPSSRNDDKTTLVAAPDVESKILAETKFTLKARQLLSKFGLSEQDFRNHPNRERITEEDVLIFYEKNRPQAPQKQEKAFFPKAKTIHLTQERVLVLGAGGGASLVIDIISRTRTQVVAAILDNNKALHGSQLEGFEILGGFEKIDELIKRSAFDTVISTIVKDNHHRKNIFDELRSAGLEFTNVIDPSCYIGLGSQLGTGNLIIHGGYIATKVTVGHNNFLAAGTFIEHHSVIGDHCTFGPRTSLSGKVTVGDCVKFGTNVAVEPFVTIGENSIIASGVAVNRHIPSNGLVKSQLISVSTKI